jgi:hypothetical protein
LKPLTVFFSFLCADLLCFSRFLCWKCVKFYVDFKLKKFTVLRSPSNGYIYVVFEANDVRSKCSDSRTCEHPNIMRHKDIEPHRHRDIKTQRRRDIKTDTQRHTITET